MTIPFSGCRFDFGAFLNVLDDGFTVLAFFASDLLMMVVSNESLLDDLSPNDSILFKRSSFAFSGSLPVEPELGGWLFLKMFDFLEFDADFVFDLGADRVLGWSSSIKELKNSLESELCIVELCDRLFLRLLLVDRESAV